MALFIFFDLQGEYLTRYNQLHLKHSARFFFVFLKIGPIFIYNKER